MKKRKIDFILYEDADDMIIFRFRPRQSSCHSFNDKPPTKWNEVYKTYFSYKIFKVWKEDGTEEKLFECGFDECSVIDEVAERIKYIVDGKKSLEIERDGRTHTIQLIGEELYPFGEGVSWIIDEKDEDSSLYAITMWNYNNTGYRFLIKRETLKQFGEYLSKCCEYMLAHGDPI